MKNHVESRPQSEIAHSFIACFNEEQVMLALYAVM